MPESSVLRLPLMREALGEALRAIRLAQGRSLRDVSRSAQTSLGYISEIERGVKEASSELLAGIAASLDVPLSRVLADAAERLARREAAEAGAEIVALRPRPVLSRAA